MSLPLLLAGLDETEAALMGMFMTVGLLFYLIHSVKRIRETRETEQTKREIAAYVAEGSINADDAVKLLAASSTDDPARVIADGVAGGTINPEKAEKLIRTLRAEQAGKGQTAST